MLAFLMPARVENCGPMRLVFHFALLCDEPDIAYWGTSGLLFHGDGVRVRVEVGWTRFVLVAVVYGLDFVQQLAQLGTHICVHYLLRLLGVHAVIPRQLVELLGVTAVQIFQLIMHLIIYSTGKLVIPHSL